MGLGYNGLISTSCIGLVLCPLLLHVFFIFGHRHKDTDSDKNGSTFPWSPELCHISTSVGGKGAYYSPPPEEDLTLFFR